MQKILFLLLLCFFSNTAMYASIHLKPLDLAVSHHAIGKSVLVYEDSSSSMGISDIIKLPTSVFTPLNKPVSSHNFTDSAFWYQFKVKNSENSLLSRLIIFEPAWLDHVHITIISPQGEIKSYQGGNTLPYDKGAIDHYLINFKHSFEPGLSTVYVQVKTRDPFIVSISVYFFVLASLLFSRSFLNLQKYHSTLFLITTYLIYGILIIFIISALLGGYHYHVIFSIVSVMVASSYIFGIALYSWMTGNRSARFFLLGAISGLIGAFVTALTVMSIIPYSYITYKANDFGMYIDVVLLSIALADRMKITQEKKLKAEKEAQTDILTGLQNRRAYYEISSREYQRLLRYHRDFSVIMVDIDDFKEINDNYGHHEGDSVLKSIAFIIKENIRENDYAFRVGGDEFLILLPETNEEKAYHLAERMRSEIENIKLQSTTYTYRISSSFGISQFIENDVNLEAVAKRADEALYQVKNSGKNRVETWRENVIP